MPAAKSLRPVKQKRALLESNPPRDNWIERRRNKKRLRIWGGQNLPKWNKETFISEPEHALKTHRPRSDKAPNGQPKTNGKKYLSFFSHAAFHAEPVQEAEQARLARVVLESKQKPRTIAFNQLTNFIFLT